MTRFAKHQNTYTPASNESLEVLDELPPGNYIMQFPPIGPAYYECVDDFMLPDKIYGDVTKNSERILSTFVSRAGATGVLLSGEKGSGKTLLAKHVASMSGYPCILVNSPLKGDTFNTMLQNLTQPAIVLFDEFEKVYNDNKGEQDSMLTLLDGVFTSKKLFLFTCNDMYRINACMHNRPGRIFYSLSFKGLPIEAIKEYCDDRLENTSHKDAICGLSMMFREFNFDMLAALIEEMNRYNESPKEALQMLNVKPLTVGKHGKFEVKLLIDGKDRKVTCPTDGKFDENPAFNDNGFYVSYMEKCEHDEDDVECVPDAPTPFGNRRGARVLEKARANDEMYQDEASFNQSDLKAVNQATETYTFVNSDGETAIITRAKSTGRASYYDAF